MFGSLHYKLHGFRGIVNWFVAHETRYFPEVSLFKTSSGYEWFPLKDAPAKSQLNVILSKLECSSIHCPHPLIPSPGGRGVRSERPVCGSPSPAQSVGEGVRGVRECSNQKQILQKTLDFLPYHLGKNAVNNFGPFTTLLPDFQVLKFLPLGHIFLFVS